jgi:hypothetical protein
MKTLRYSRELNDVVEIKDTLTTEEALRILTRELLGRPYYIADPVCTDQANSIIVRDILRNYKPKRWARK